MTENVAAYQTVSRVRTRFTLLSLEATDPGLYAKPITRSSQGLKELRLEVVIDLPAQSPHEHFEHVGERIVVIVPHMRSDRSAIDDMPCVKCETFQKTEFLGGKLDFTSGAFDLLRADVDLEVCNRDNVPNRRCLPARECAKTSDQLAEGERLRQIVIGARLESRDPVVYGISRSQHQDRRRDLTVSQIFAEFEPGPSGKHHIEHDNIERIEHRLHPAIGKVVGYGDTNSFFLESAGDNVRKGSIVFHEQNTHDQNLPRPKLAQGTCNARVIYFRYVYPLHDQNGRIRIEMHRLAWLSAGVVLCWSTQASSQSVTRQQAVDSALARGGRLAIALADTAAANAKVLAARALQNPSFNATYSKAAPQLHFIADLPFDLPGVRSARISSAVAASRGANYTLRFERAAIALAADTAYTRVLAATARARLTARNALVADTLVTMTIARRNAGDASELEVEMSRVNAGQQHNLAIADSVELAGAIVDLQTAMGIVNSTPIVLVRDSIALPDTTTPALAPGTPLQVAAALEAVTAAHNSLTVERRSAFGAPSLMGGFETRDPSGADKGLLPTFGFSIPLPIFNRNQAGIATARAEVRRAEADLALIRVDYAAAVVRAQRERSAAYARAARDQILLAQANRVAQMSVTAYKAGAMALPNVFEAQRTARDILRDYINDLSAALVADATLHLLTLTTAQ